MIILQGVGYTHPDKDLLFTDINLTVNRHDKIALTGNNGSGKTTLLKIMAGILQPTAGHVKTAKPPYYMPQVFGQYNHYTVAQAMKAATKLDALHEILKGNVTENNMALLDDDWAIEERCAEALAHWQLNGVLLTDKMGKLSGGQKTKVFLAGIMVHSPEIVLLDEPSNHLDTEGRNILYTYITTTTNTLVVVSHDRALLNLLPAVCEIDKRGITVYGGNYDFYTEQKETERNAFDHELKSKEKALRKAKETAKETIERQQKLDARGRKKQEKAGLPTISMNTLRNSAERSTSRIKEVHAGKVDNISQEVNKMRKELPATDKMKMQLDDSALHKGKILVKAKDVNISYGGVMLWKHPFSFEIASGERIAIKGSNGSGKTSLIKMILGKLQPTAGSMESIIENAIYIDQEYSLIDNSLTVYEQVQQYNTAALQEHEVKIRLTRFLFTKNDWNKPCSALSGGKKMRLILCCLTTGQHAPDMIVLDEPTNNLDIQNIEILTAAINDYKGTLLVVSHDAYFLKEVNVNRSIDVIRVIR